MPAFATPPLSLLVEKRPRRDAASAEQDRGKGLKKIIRLETRKELENWHVAKRQPGS